MLFIVHPSRIGFLCLTLALLGARLPSALATPASRPGLHSGLWDSALSPRSGRYGMLLGRIRDVLSQRPPRIRALRRARRWANEAIRLAPRRPQGWILKGQVAARRHAWAEAATAFARVRKIDPTFRPRQTALWFAMAAFRAGRFLEAGGTLAGLPRPGDSPQVMARLLTNAAEAFSAAGHLHEAIRLYLRAAVAAPAYPPARWGLAVARHRSGQFTLAQKIARLALSMDPTSRAILGPSALYAVASDRIYHRALLAEARGDLRTARRLWRAYLRDAPQSPWRVVVRRALARIPLRTRRRPLPRGTTRSRSGRGT